MTSAPNDNGWANWPLSPIRSMGFWNRRNFAQFFYNYANTLTIAANIPRSACWPTPACRVLAGFLERLNSHRRAIGFLYCRCGLHNSHRFFAGQSGPHWIARPFEPCHQTLGWPSSAAFQAEGLANGRHGAGYCQR